MKYKNIHFIINPISGKGVGLKLKRIIENKLNKVDYIIKVTTKKNDAYNMALSSISENADLIVSCGGDGTLNEVASALVYKDTPLAIIPIGSGNGLARNLKIDLKIEKALDHIISFKKDYVKIDCGKVNDSYFFSNMGIGFDSAVVKTYANQSQRKLIGYAKSIILTIFNFSAVKLLVKSSKLNTKDKFMMFFISNSNCMGYNFSTTPKASLTDGLIDIVAIKKCNLFIFSLISLQILFRCLKNKKTIQFKTNELTIEKEVSYVQIDGEYQEIEDKLNIKILKEAINILPGKNFY